MTGPSLADIWNRKAGSLSSFPRYSDVMKSSDVIWNAKTLDGYLENPAQFMHGNHMTFAGVPDEKTRKSIIAFLKQAGEKSADNLNGGRTGQAQMGGMPGMQRPVPNLKAAEASSRIKAITYCRDTFKVTTTDGKTRDFWERNLRFKTDSSEGRACNRQCRDDGRPGIHYLLITRGNQPIHC
jgi:cytochrome c